MLDRTPSISAVLLALAACVGASACDDGAGTGGAGGSGASSTSTGTTTTSSTTTASGSTTSTTSGSGSSTSSGGDLCANLPAGPLTPVEVTDKFNGSEDFTFDDAGGMVSRDGQAVIRIDAANMTTMLGTLPQSSFGLRYGSTKDLFIALPNQGKIVKLAAMGGAITDFVTGLAGPNGVYPDLDGNLWVTEFSGGRVVKVDAQGQKTTIVSNVNSPNGVVLDTTRNLLFYTAYNDGEVYRIAPTGGMQTLVGSVNNAALDGLVLDACGNVYAVDQGNSRIYRFNLDAGGVLVGQPELIADLPTNVANAQFGQTGFDANTLYATGNPGVVYAIPVGVGGAPIPP